MRAKRNEPERAATELALDRRALLGLTAGALAAFHVRPRVKRGDEAEDLVHWIVVTPRERVLARAVREFSGGLDERRLLGALLVAAAREIRPDIARFNHAALVVSSVDQLRARGPAGASTALVLWNLDYFKEAQELDATSNDFHMQPPRAREARSADAARRELISALEAWDPEAADAAVAPFVEATSFGDAFELLWEFGARCQANLGHKAIYAAQAHRALPLAGERYTIDVARSLVASLFLHGKSERSEPFERSRAIVKDGVAPRADALANERDAMRELRDALQDVAPSEAPAAAAELLRQGAPPRALWTALAIAASDLVVAEPSVGALHALTSLNALHYAARAATTERVRTLALLQATAWACLFRDSALKARDGKQIPSADPIEVDFADARALVAARADDVHEVKLAAAALEEIELADPAARPALSAALSVHLPPRDRADGDARARIREALATQRAR